MATGVSMTAFADWLQTELDHRGWNQSRLAAYMGKRQQTVSAWFNDDRIPSPALCEILARTLRIPIDEVMRRAGHLPPSAEEDSSPEIIPELRAVLAEMTPEEQRRFAQPAIALAQSLVQEARRQEES